MSNKLTRPAFWIAITTLGQGWKLLASMASAVLLSRFLTPADFGLIATTAPIVGFADMIRDAGFGQALVQRSGVTQRQAHGLFWLLMGLTGLLCVVIILLSPLIANYFEDRRIADVLFASTGVMLIASFGSQPVAWLNRHLEFQRITVIEVTAATMAMLTGILVAWTTQSYWSIVIAGAVSALTTALMACMFSGWRPGRPVFDSSVAQMVRFGANVSFSNVMNFVARNVDNLLISKMHGQTELGYYDRAYKLMLLPLSQVTWPIARVLTPLLSRMQDQAQDYSRLYFRTITAMMIATQPAMITAAVVANPIIDLLLGPKWHESGPIFSWLAIAAVHQLVTSSHGWLYLSQGRGRDYAIVGLFGSVTTIGSFIIGIRWGALGVAQAYVVSDYLLRLPFAWLFVGRQGPVRTGPLLAVALPHAVACAATCVATLALYEAVGLSGVRLIAATVLTAYIAYLSCIAMFPSKRSLIVEFCAKMTSRR